MVRVRNVRTCQKHIKHNEASQDRVAIKAGEKLAPVPAQIRNTAAVVTPLSPSLSIDLSRYFKGGSSRCCHFDVLVNGPHR